MELIGRRFGHIRVTEVVGQGGMGDVYAGYDEKLERKVALKVLNSDQRLDDEARERLLREARALSRLEHPNICRIHDYIETGDVDLLVLEYIDGRTLHDALSDKMPRSEKLRIAGAIAEVLVKAHRAGIVHRDLKPENVMLTKSGEVKVLDFGLARWLNRAKRQSSDRLSAIRVPVRGPADAAAAPAETMIMGPTERPLPTGTDRFHSDGMRREFLATAVGITLGTPIFMSPEQARGESLTPASDMFSFGLLLQTLFTGQDPHPLGLSAREVILRVARGETLPVQGVEGDVTALINRLKQFAPADRPTALEALERIRMMEEKPQRIARRAIVGAIALIALLGAWRYTVDLKAERAIAVAARAEAERRRAQAEDLINFMVGDLRSKLEAVGRLEVMDDVAERVLAHMSAASTETLATGEIVQSVKALNQLGEVRRDQGRTKDALAIFERSLGLSNIAVQRAPDDVEAQKALMNSEFAMATVFLATAEYDRALQHFRAQLAVAERMAKAHPADESWQTELAQAHGNVGTTLEWQGDIQDALRQYDRSLAIKERLRDRLPGDASRQADVATARNKLGAAAFKLRRFDDALDQFSREIAIYQRLAAADPRNSIWLRRLAVGHAFRAAVLEDMGNLARAAEERRVETELTENLFDLDRTNVEWRRHLSLAHVRRANLARLAGHGAESVRLYKHAASLLAPLLAQEARPVWKRDMIRCDVGLSRALLLTGDVTQAIAAATRALQAAYALSPGSDGTNATVEALMASGEAYEAAGDKVRAAEQWKKSLETLSPTITAAAEARTLMLWSNVLERVGRAAEGRAVASSLVLDGYRHPDCRLCAGG